MSNIQVSKLNTLRGHNHSVFALANGCQTNLIYTGSGDGMVVEWNLSELGDGLLLAKLPSSVYALEVDKQRNVLFIGQNNEGIHAIDLKSKKEIWSLKITSHPIFDIKVLDNLLLVATGDGVLVVIDIEERSPVRHIKISDQSLRVLAVAPNQKQIAVGASDHLIKVFDTQDWSPLARMQGHLNSVFALAYSPDGKTIVSGGRDASLKFWDTEKFEIQQNIAAHMYAINYLSFREDGKYFVTCSMDKSIKVWDMEAFKLLKVIDKARYVGHGTSINKVLWTKNKDQVVAISDDHTVSVWEINIGQ
ncbi:WD40 repeat domain-containing protein [Cyclobacterium marinum]|uniref:WD40 repeat-containing protein n=1 Tax=Cyclobacterium marinum (strain ATCC 25205 / DSM 745 / LMG 13164 / NCIMB 1802) TaxID=880070 RepID=G0IYG3_CYCMS|nr:WD40 repeat domain-containing protein [Cyclobacterium marinum]AEL26386.1 WD40 repeat-containing protein [Cyclobacterium marinum DSM 745]